MRRAQNVPDRLRPIDGLGARFTKMDSRGGVQLLFQKVENKAKFRKLIPILPDIGHQLAMNYMGARSPTDCRVNCFKAAVNPFSFITVT